MAVEYVNNISTIIAFEAKVPTDGSSNCLTTAPTNSIFSWESTTESPVDYGSCCSWQL